MKRLLLITFVGLFSASAFAADNKPPTSEQQTASQIDELKRKIAKDPERDICINSTELVRVLVEQFNNQMNAGELKPAQQTLDEIGEYADKAREAGKKSHHKLKQAEMTLHKSARRLADIAQSVAVENRQAITQVVNRIEAADDDILNQVFKN